MTQQDQDIFFSILRAAIWETEPDLYIPDGYDWQPLIDAFTDHALLGVVAHTLMSLPATKRPSMQQSISIFNHVGNLTRMHYTLEEAIINLFTLFEENNLHPVLLKGEGLAAIYPKDCVRACGDIDIYINTEEFDRAKELLDSFMGDDATSKDSPMHYEICNGELVVELHHRPIYASSHERDELVNDWARHQLLPENCSIAKIRDKKKRVPSSDFNVFYIYDHLLKHTYTYQPALRQYVDWLQTLRNAQIDTAILQHVLSTFSRVKSWQRVSGILHHQLGMPTDMIPFWNSREAKRSQGILLQFYLDKCNMGRIPTQINHHELGNSISRYCQAFAFHLLNYRSIRTIDPEKARTIFLDAFVSQFWRIPMRTLGLRRD